MMDEAAAIAFWQGARDFFWLAFVVLGQVLFWLWLMGAFDRGAEQ